MSLVAADQSTDEKTATNYFTVRIKPDQTDLQVLKNSKLVPGMPAEVFIQTGARTALSYLTKPLSDQIQHAFREK